jgi:hypothetical protein
MQPAKSVGETYLAERGKVPTSDAKESAMRQSFDRIAEQIEAAVSLEEFQMATAALSAWGDRYPEERDGVAAIFSQLFMLEEAAREAEKEADAMRLSADEQRQRQDLIRLRRRVRGTDSLAEFCSALQEARRALEAWRAAHPEDPEIPSLVTQLDVEEELAAHLQRKR